MSKFYKNGFYTKPVDGGVEITDAYWKELLDGQSAGHIIVPNEEGFPILSNPIDCRTYKEKRAAEYPELGDVIDALIKARGGDISELETICAERQNIKAKYPKE